MPDLLVNTCQKNYLVLRNYLRACCCLIHYVIYTHNLHPTLLQFIIHSLTFQHSIVNKNTATNVLFLRSCIGTFTARKKGRKEGLFQWALLVD